MALLALVNAIEIDDEMTVVAFPLGIVGEEVIGIGQALHPPLPEDEIHHHGIDPDQGHHHHHHHATHGQQFPNGLGIQQINGVTAHRTDAQHGEHSDDDEHSHHHTPSQAEMTAVMLEGRMWIVHPPTSRARVL